MDTRRIPYTEEEADEAWHWVNRHGPSNSWTATGGTAARMIGRLLEERERLLKQVESLQAFCKSTNHDAAPAARAPTVASPLPDCGQVTVGMGTGESHVTEPMLKEKRAEVSCTNHDAAPAARARVDAAGISRQGTGKQTAPPRVETDGLTPDSRTGPINRTPECEPPRRECGESLRRDVTHPDTKGRAAGGPAHLSYPKSDEERVFSDAIRGTTPPRNGALAHDSVGVSQPAIEPVAWAMVEADGRIEATFTDKDEAAEWCDETLRIVPLYRQPPCQDFSQKNLTLADAEREAVEWAVQLAKYSLGQAERYDALRGLLERPLGDSYTHKKD